MFSANCESTFRFDKGTIFYQTGLKKAWTQMLLNVAVHVSEHGWRWLRIY